MATPTIAVYARAGNGTWQLAGHANLELPRLLSARPDLRQFLSSHPQLTERVAHITWAEGGEPRSELIDVIAVGPIESFRGSQPGVGLELRHASEGPTIHLPPGPGHDGFWCVLFPWASFCGP